MSDETNTFEPKKFTASEKIRRRQCVATSDGFVFYKNLEGSPISDILVSTRDIEKDEVVSVGNGLCAAYTPRFMAIHGCIDEDDEILEATFIFIKINDWNDGAS